MASKTKRDLANSLVSQIGYKLIGFLTVALLARYLEKDDYGRLTMSLSLCAAAVLLTDLGLSSDLVRKTAVTPTRIQEYLRTTLSTRIPLLFGFILTINGVIALTKPDLLPFVAGISVYTALKDLHRTYSSAFTGLRRIGRSIASFSAGISVTLVGVAFCKHFHLNTAYIITSYLIGGATMLGMAMVLFRSIAGPITINLSCKIVRTNVFNAWGLFALTGLSYLHYALDTISLGFLSSYRDVAAYEAALRLYEASQFAIRPVTLIMFPISAKLFADAAWPQFRSLLNKMFLSAAGIGILGTLAAYVLAEPIINFVYSEEFASSAGIMKVLFAATPSLFLATVGLFVSASQNRESFACIVVLGAIVVKLLANLWVIPSYGPSGTAIVNLITQSAVALILCIDAYRSLPKAFETEHRS